MKNLIRYNNLREIACLCLLCLSILLSCTGRQTEKPSISDENLAQIMADLKVAEAATIGLSGYQKDSLMKVYFAQVFEIHGTDLEEYEKNLRIVSADMNHFQRILLESLELLEQKDDKAAE